LKDEADVPSAETVAGGLGQFGDILAVDFDRAGVDCREAGNAVEQRGFSTTAATAQNHLFAAGDGQAGHVENRQRLAVGLDVRLADGVEDQHGKGAY
jgi:hypothetical protein